MSLWVCSVHGLYGGDVFCPACGDTGQYWATFTPAQVDRSPEGQDPERGLIGDESPVGEADAPEPLRFQDTDGNVRPAE